MLAMHQLYCGAAVLDSCIQAVDIFSAAVLVHMPLLVLT